MAVATEIQITKTGEEPGAKNLRVEVSVERVHQAEDKAARQYAKRAKLPGFRPGKAPLTVVKRQFKDAIRESVIRELIGESWKAAVDQEQLKPIADPRIRDLKFETDAPVTFELVVEVKPELQLERLGGFTLTRKTPRVTDAMVAQQIDELRKQKAPWTPVEGERPRQDDLVSVTIATAEADQPGEPGAAGAGDAAKWGEPRQYQIQLGAGQALPDLEDKVMELKPGETGERVVRFPDDFPDESKRGQSRAVRITVHEVKRQRSPDLSDEFARELGDFNTVADLERAIREDLEAEARREADAEVRRQLIEEIITANGVEAPRPMVHRVLSAFAQTYEVPDEQLERFAQEFTPIAERQVKRDLVIDHVSEKHEIRATEEDVDGRIAEIAKRRNVEPGQVYTSLQKAGRLKELERNLTEEKVFDHLLEQSTIKDA